jgi:hypothetical protein
MSDVDLPRRLRQYGAELQLRRVALTPNDLVGLPSFDADTKAGDPRYKWFQENVATACYELDAMPPPRLRTRVETEIRSLIDLRLWDHACEIERVEVESMKEFHKSWQASICGEAAR